jgi:predicted RecA/RadA family phage recombinase
MARNYVQPGDTLTFIAPYAVASGAGFLVGAQFAVALNDAFINAPVEGRTAGVWDLTKATGEAWTAWTKIYWDNTNKRCTTTASGNTLIGLCTQGAASAATVGRVKLGWAP